MTVSKLDARQVVSRDLLDQIATATGSELDNILRSLNDEVTPPLRMSSSSTPDLVLTIDPISVQNSETGKNKIIPTISNTLPVFNGGTVTIPATSGGTVTVSPGTNTTLTLGVGNFIKMGINLDATGSMSVTFGIEGATIDAATAPPAINNTFAIGYVVLENDTGVIQNIENQDIYQYVGGGGGGSGSGDASSVITRLQDMFEDSIFQQLTAIDFGINEDDQVDGSSTGSYSIVDSSFGFTAAAETLVTTNLLSADEFTADSKIIGKVNLVVFWKEGLIDDAATYEVSIDGFGVDINEITMERVGNATETFVGAYTYEETTATATLQIRVTASQAGNIAGYGLFYDVEGEVAGGTKLFKNFSFLSNTDNLDTFDLGWIADTDLLDVFHVETGQVYKYPAFSQVGTTIVFPANTFQQASDEQVTLKAVQAEGSSFDTSDQNAAAIAGNHLGSDDPTLDKSVAGRGIFLRRPDGTLRELIINDLDEIEIYSV